MYRDYKNQPLDMKEIRELFSMLKQPAHTLLRKKDKAFSELKLNGSESDEVLFSHFVAYPTLMERPIFIHNGKAVVCRPFDRLLEILYNCIGE